MIGTTDYNIDCDYRIYLLPEELEKLQKGEPVVGDYVQRNLDGFVRDGLSLKFDESFRGYVNMIPEGKSVGDLDSLEIIIGERGLSRLKEIPEHYDARSDWADGRKVHFHFVSEKNSQAKRSYDSLCQVRDYFV